MPNDRPNDDSGSTLAAPLAPGDGDRPDARAFTVKSVLFGLFGVLLVVVATSFNDDVIRQTFLIGNHLPVVVVCYVLALAAGWNPVWFGLARLFRAPRLRGMALSAPEMTVILAAALVACFAPSSGFHRYFMKNLVLPWHELNTNPGWEPAMAWLPRDLFPLGADPAHPDYDRVFGGLRSGLRGEEVGFWDVPWAEWLGPAARWAPLVVCFAVASLALAMAVQRQWSRHEQLSYPLAIIFNSLIDRRRDRGWPEVFRSRLFLVAALAVILFHAHNLASPWIADWPKPIPKEWRAEWGRLMPVLYRAGQWDVNVGRLFFTVIGLAYFLSGEIAFTMGISQYLLAFGLSAQFYLATGRPLGTEDIDLLRFGAYLGYAAILVYTGRTWYWTILLKALGRGRPAAREADSVWAARTFLLSFAGMVLALAWIGLPWAAGLAFSAVVMLFMLVFTRIICETGIPFMQMVRGNAPMHYLMRLTGFSFWGPKTVVYFYFLTSMLMQDPRECLMPYGATGFKAGEDHGVRARRLFVWGAGAVMLALVVGFAAHAYLLYSKGGGMLDSWASVNVPREIFGNSTRALNQINAGGADRYALSVEGGVLDRLTLLAPAPLAWRWAIVGFALVLGFSAARFRWTGWPIHPVLFLVWGTMPSSQFYNSFLIGWAVKALIVRFGGGRVYQRCKPAFLGLIAGELAICGVGILIGFLYYFVQGQPPPYTYGMFPY